MAREVAFCHCTRMGVLRAGLWFSLGYLFAVIVQRV